MKLKRGIEKRDIINIAAILLLTVFFIWVGAQYMRTFGGVEGGDIVSSAENMREFVLSYGNSGIIVMVGLHAFQVVISFIPAALVQFAGGLIYGMFMGMVTGIAGIAIGTAISFYLSRFLGRRVVTLYVSEKNLNKLEGFISKDTSTLVLTALFIFPGFPKDFIAYFVGLTNIKASRFFIISAVGRLPGMLVSNYLGTSVFSGNYALIITITVLCCVLFLLLYLFRDRLIKYLSK